MTTLCAWCDDMVKADGKWFKDYMRYSEITGTPGLSHSICPECHEKVEEDIKRFQVRGDVDDIGSADGGRGE